MSGFARVALATTLARLVGQIWGIVLVLFILQRYHSPALAGLAVFLSLFPGLLLSPVVGALLDRQGRVRLMIIDFCVTAVVIGGIGLLSLANALPPPLMLALVTILSVSNIFSIAGARSMFPLMLPPELWDRANGIDNSAYALTSILGPAIAGVAFARLGGEIALLVTGALAALAALSLVRVPDPVGTVIPTNSLLRDAWNALNYVLAHRSLRGLAITVFVNNLGAGVMVVGIPLVILQRLHGSAATVGQIFAVFGIAGLVGGLLYGRVAAAGRERIYLAATLAVQVPVMIGIALAGNFAVLVAVAVVGGAAEAMANIGIFSLRQRRTDPAWFGRAFAVSMAFNFAGVPVGSAISGPLLERSLVWPFLLGAAIVLVACVVALTLIPKVAEPPDRPA